MKTKTTLKKQKILIIVLGTLVLAAAVLCIVLPLVFKEELNTVYAFTEYGDNVEVMIYDKVTGSSLKGEIEAIRNGEKNTLSLKEGEGDVLYTFRKDNVELSYQPYIFPEVQLAELSEVTVTNSNGSFCVFNDGKQNFFIRGAEANLYNKQLLSELLLQSRYMLADKYVENPSSPEDYGVTEDTFSAKVEVTSADGEKNVVYVGSRELGGARYYMKHADKAQIYVMDSGAEAFFNDIRVYLSADVVKIIDEQQRNYYTSFTLNKNSTPFFACEIIPEEQRVGVLSNQLHRMTYPAEALVLNTTTVYDMFSQCGSLSGLGVIEYGVSSREDSDEIMALYGLDAPVAEVSYSLADKEFGFSVGKQEELDGESCYYVYSPYQDTVVLVPGSSLSFLDNAIVDMFQPNVFQYNIGDVASIELKHGTNTENYVLSGESSSLTVTESISGKTIDTPSFRQFYISLLSVTIGGYSSVEGTVSDTRRHELTFTVTLKSGEKLVFDFYGESTMSCHMIVDGTGGFKTDRKWIDKIIENSEKLINGETIASSI